MSCRPILTFLLLCTAVLLSTPVKAQNTTPIKIVASFTILADMIEQVGREDVVVISLVGPDQDAHDFQPKPTAVKDLVDAQIIAINGLKFEGWIGRLIKASGTKAKLLVATAGVKPRVMSDRDHHTHHDHADGEIAPDPHAWQDLRNAKIYLKNIAAALAQERPEKAELFKQRAKDYLAQLMKLDEKTRAALAAIPVNKRTIITSHDAFGYFAAAYGLTILSPSGIDNESEPSAADVAKLITQINNEGIKAIFIENMSDPRLIQQIAKDTGARIDGKLYTDALSKPDGEAPTYLDMMRHNANAIINGLQGQAQ